MLACLFGGLVCLLIWLLVSICGVICVKKKKKVLLRHLLCARSGAAPTFDTGKQQPNVAASDIDKSGPFPLSKNPWLA